MQIDAAVAVARIAIGIALVLSSLELVRASDLYADSGLLSWRVLGARRRSGPGWLAALTAPLFGAIWFRRLLLIRTLCGMSLCVPLPWTAHAVALSLAAAASLVVSYRNIFGGDGSDQMTLIVVIGLLVVLAGRTTALQIIGLAFIAAECLLSYAVAGFAKLRSRTWRNGTALPLILRTTTFGHAKIWSLVRERRWLSLTLCWATIAFEVIFSLSLWIPSPYFELMLAAGVGFHFGTAVVMGLNVFPWAFLATYPAVWVIRQWL